MQDPCSTNPCYNGASCAAQNSNNYVCLCPPGYSGSRCESAVGLCKNNNCQNGAVCQPSGSSYWCLCPTGYTGPYCQTAINYCVSKPCKNGGICITSQTTGSYYCSCTGISYKFIKLHLTLNIF